MMEIRVYGLPAPQGSKRLVGRDKQGRGILVESSKRVRPWREAVKLAALAVLEECPLSTGRHCNGGLSGAVQVEMVFTLPKPKSAPKNHRTWPDRRPDLSKLIRSTEDALTDAGVWEDDARIVRMFARKAFPGEGNDALHVPGAVIRVSEVALKEGTCE